MVFSPPKSVGLAIGVAVITFMALLDVYLVAAVRAAPPSLLTFAFVCLVLASLPTLVWLGDRCYGLARARYVLSRNALVVEWGRRRELIPMRMIGEMRAGTDVAERLRPRGITWPGCVVGHADSDSLGRVEFLAAAGQAGLVLVNYSGGWLAISPEDPQAFVAAFAERQAEGPLTQIEPESVRPNIARWPLLADRLAVALIALGGMSTLLLVGFLSALYPQLPSQIALHFNAQGQPDRFGTPNGLFILPVIAGLAWLLNTLGGVWLHRYENERAGAYLLFGATVFVQALVWAATVGLLTAGRAA